LSKEERQTKKEIRQLVYPNHLKYLKKLKSDLKKDRNGTNMTRYTKKKRKKK
tara:strand:- start:1687 stop:1842 length:156 start_codon:yes stop_codon:yes gene_type:complete